MIDQEGHLLMQAQSMARHRAQSTPRPIVMLAVFAILISAAALMVSRDMLVRDQVQTTLQMAADQAAMAGAAYLPNWPARALRAAEQSAELSGLGRGNVLFAGPAPDGTSFRVALKCAAPIVFLRMFGAGAEITAVSIMGSPTGRRPVSLAHAIPPASRTAAADSRASASPRLLSVVLD
jgi:hypothetical protein